MDDSMVPIVGVSLVKDYQFEVKHKGRRTT